MPESPSDRSEAWSLTTDSSSSSRDGGGGGVLRGEGGPRREGERWGCCWGCRGFMVTGSNGTCGTRTGGGGEGEAERRLAGE